MIETLGSTTSFFRRENSWSRSIVYGWDNLIGQLEGDDQLLIDTK